MRFPNEGATQRDVVSNTVCDELFGNRVSLSPANKDQRYPESCLEPLDGFPVVDLPILGGQSASPDWCDVAGCIRRPAAYLDHVNPRLFEHRRNLERIPDREPTVDKILRVQLDQQRE